MAALEDILRTKNWKFSKLGLRVQWKAPEGKRIFQTVNMKEESVYSFVEKTALCCAWKQKENPKEFEREFLYCEAWPLFGSGKPQHDSFEVASYVLEDKHLENFKVTIDATAWVEDSARCYPDGFCKGRSIRCSEGHTSPVPAYHLHSCSGRRELGEHMLVRKFVYEVRGYAFPKLEDDWVTRSGTYKDRYWHCKYYETYADDFRLTDTTGTDSKLRI